MRNTILRMTATAVVLFIYNFGIGQVYTVKGVNVDSIKSSYVAMYLYTKPFGNKSIVMIDGIAEGKGSIELKLDNKVVDVTYTIEAYNLMRSFGFRFVTSYVEDNVLRHVFERGEK